MLMAIMAESLEIKRTQAERTARSDSQMLDTAIKLICEYGTGRTTLKAVGETAGFSRGLAGSRFGSKEGLMIFVVLSVSREWLADLTAVTRGKVGLDAIDAATDAHYKFCVDAPDHVRAFYTLWFESIGPQSEVKAVIEKIHERRRQDVEHWINEGIKSGQISADVDAAAIALQFCANIIGIVYQWLIMGDAHKEIKSLHIQLKRSTHIALCGHTRGIEKK